MYLTRGERFGSVGKPSSTLGLVGLLTSDSYTISVIEVMLNQKLKQTSRLLHWIKTVINRTCAVVPATAILYSQAKVFTQARG